jgi:hypothetical protein
MSRITAWFSQERHRAYLYRVIVAGGGVAFFYGILSAEEVAVWSGLVATAFALPAANTSTKAPKA